MRNSANIELMGYVYGDPEQPMPEKHPNWVKFSLSVTRKWKDRNGEEKKEISWFKCNAWSEGLCRMIKKNVSGGMGLMIRGSPRASAWIDAEGGAKAQIEVNISEINMLTFPKDKEAGDNANTNANGRHKLSPKASSSGQPDGDIEDDDIPF